MTMSSKNTSFLINSFPNLIPKYELYDSINKYTFTIDCEDGWTNHLYMIFSNINELINIDIDKFPNNLKVSQIKSKFGSLRIFFNCDYSHDLNIKKIQQQYMNNLYNYVNGFCKEALNICEFCGKIENKSMFKKYKHSKSCSNNFIIYRCICNECLKKYNHMEIIDD